MKYKNNFYWIKLFYNDKYTIAEKNKDDIWFCIGMTESVEKNEFEVIEKVKDLTIVKILAYEI